MSDVPRVLGIDGGGTKTVAWLAQRGPDRQWTVLGRGLAGAANIQSVGRTAALASLDRAVMLAFDAARLPPAAVDAAVVALAGSDRPENRQMIEDWARGRMLAAAFRVVHDAEPVVAAGTPDGWGVALIAGTGSLAYGRAADGRTARAGGWGYLLGDEGSGYWLALRGLRAAVLAADGRGPATGLLAAMLARLEIDAPTRLVSAVYPWADDRARLAALAAVVLTQADAGDPVARRIVDRAGRALAAMVAAVVREFAWDQVPLAMAGGVLLGSPRLQRRLRFHLDRRPLVIDSIGLVPEPVCGAVRLATSLVD